MPQTALPNLGTNYNYDVGDDGWGAGMDRNLVGLDALTMPRVQTRTLNAPPGSPAQGLAWIVGSSPTGAWAGKAGQIAVASSAAVGGWFFFVPKSGWTTYVVDEDLEYFYNGSAWGIKSTAFGNSLMRSADAATARATLGAAPAFGNQSANQVYAGPTTGGAAAPLFRALVAADIPSIPLSKISDAGSMSSQNSNAVNISGGSVNTSGDNSATGAGQIRHRADSTSGGVAAFSVDTLAGLARWKFARRGAESSGDLGADLALWSYTDAGAFKSTVLTAFRSSGNLALASTSDDGNRLQVNGSISLSANTLLTPTAGAKFSINTTSSSAGRAVVLENAAATGTATFTSFAVNTHNGSAVDLRTLVGGTNSSTTFGIYGGNASFLTSYGAGGLAIVSSVAGSSIRFANGGETAGNEAMRIAPTTNNLLVGKTTDDTFAKIQSSNGITLGNTANANPAVLDWYEEGTFTPVVLGLTTPGVGTYSVQIGNYTRKGNKCSVQLSVEWSAHTGTGTMRIGGLPFAAAPITNNFAPCAVYANQLAIGAGKQLAGLFLPGTSQIALRAVDVAGGAAILIPMDASAFVSIAVEYQI